MRITGASDFFQRVGKGDLFVAPANNFRIKNRVRYENGEAVKEPLEISDADKAAFEKISNSVKSTLSSTEQTLEAMKMLATSALDESLSVDDRLQAQTEMVNLKLQLKKDTFGIGLGFAGKSYEECEIRVVKDAIREHGGMFIEVGDLIDCCLDIVGSQENVKEVSWSRGEEAYGLRFILDHETDPKMSTEEQSAMFSIKDIKSRKTVEEREEFFAISAGHDENRLFLSDAERSAKAIEKIESQVKKLKEVRDEFTKFEALSDAEKFESLGQGEFTRFSGNQKVFTSPFGDEAAITQRTKRLSQMEGQPEGGGKYVYWGDTAFVKIGTETDGKMIRKDVWESRKKKMLTVAGEVVLNFACNGSRNADFRLKTPENEFGKMVKKIDAFLKDSLLTNLR